MIEKAAWFVNLGDMISTVRGTYHASLKLTNRTVTFAYTGKIACLHTDLVNTAIRREIRKA